MERESILGVAVRCRKSGRVWSGSGSHADLLDVAARDLAVIDSDALVDRLQPGFTTTRGGFVSIVEAIEADISVCRSAAA
jgi:hypothetical protein